MRSPQRSKALFLDRDGVINIDHDYVHKVENCDFVEGIFDLVKAAKAKGYTIIVITNQAGIGRGFYTDQDFADFTKYIENKFVEAQAPITKTYYCPHHPEQGVGEYKRECEDRKPGPGMILKAQKEFDLDLANSIIIGDRESDIEAGVNAGLKTKILLPHKNHPGETKADFAIKNLSEAIKYL